VKNKNRKKRKVNEKDERLVEAEDRNKITDGERHVLLHVFDDLSL